MSLTAGTRLGPYEILSLLGSGGMGDVYRAQDTKLGRDVALKILPDAFTHDPERLARFRREAQVLAALNHPHIGAIYGLDEAEGQQFLVLELVDGESLDRRIARGAIPVDEALAIAKQIAEALEAAHERGIIHRDLKPANIALNNDGNVKVLDFGLAKAIDAHVQAPSELANSPTITSPAMMTGVGVILGTAAYMSPEQAKGRAADKRSDIWAFGCVFYEMLTGSRAFDGEDIGDTLANVLKSHPDLGVLPRTAPTWVRTLIACALEKDRHRRVADVSTLRFMLDHGDTFSAPEASSRLSKRRTWPLVVSASALAALIASVVVWNLRRSPSSATPLVTRLSIAVPSSQPLLENELAVALSPDGRMLVFRGRGRDDVPTLFVRRLDQFEAKILPGTEAGGSPFFSPDGAWIGYFQGGKLLKVSSSGGSPVEVCDAPGPGRGDSWGPDDTIVFATSGHASIWRVSANGGAAQQLTELDSKVERAHRWPMLVANGKAVVFVAVPLNSESNDGTIVWKSLGTGQQRVVVAGGNRPTALANGDLVIARAGALLHLPFDPDSGTPLGKTTSIVEEVATTAERGVVQYDVSGNGTMVFVSPSSTAAQSNFVWVDRKGHEQSAFIVNKPSPSDFALSPDGTRVALTTGDTNRNVWIYDVDRAALTRLTVGTGNDSNVTWTPDGRRVVYASSRNGIIETWTKAADGSDAADTLVSARPMGVFPRSWSPDGRWLLVAKGTGPNRNDLFVAPGDGHGPLEAFASTPFNEFNGRFSPDGRWIAYQSNESGRNEIYVGSFRGQPGRWQVSTDGGQSPLWAPNSRELLYRSGDAIIACPVLLSPAFKPGVPTTLFRGTYENVYDISRDGQRFLMIRATREGGQAHLNVITNWLEEMKARVPAK